MKVVVTGGAGFLGKNIQRVFEKEGVEFVSYDFVDGFDITNKEQFEEFIALHNPDICIHLAAVANLNIYDEDIGHGHNVNVIGTQNVIDICQKHGIRMIFASTCCCYGDNKLAFSDETSKVEPTEPYSKSKRSSELHILNINKSLPQDKKIIITRLATFYGSKYTRRALAISLFIEKIHKDEQILIHGNGSQHRTYTHVYDMSTGFLALVKNINKLKHEIYNVTVQRPKSVIDIVKAISICMDKPAILKFVEDRSSQFNQLVIRNNRLRELGWSPEFTWSDGVKETIDSFHSNGDKWIN